MSFFKSQKAISLNALDEDLEAQLEEEQGDESPQRKKEEEERKEEDVCIIHKKVNKGKRKEREKQKGKNKRKDEEIDEDIEIDRTKHKKKKSKKDDLEILDSFSLPADSNYTVFQDTSVSEDSKRLELEISLKKVKYQINQIRNSVEESQEERNTKEYSPIQDPKIIDLKLQDFHGTENYKLSVYRDSPLTKLLDTLTNLVCAPSIKLTFDGITVDPNLTPKDYGMYSNNVIHFHASGKDTHNSKTSVNNIKKTNEDETNSNQAKKGKAIVLDEEEEEPKAPIKQIVEETGEVSGSEKDDEAELERELEEKLSKKAELAKQEAEENKKNSIKLVVRTAGGGEFKFRVKRTDPISKLIEAVAKNQGVSPSAFSLKFEGQILKPNKTPDFYDLENDDLLDIFKNDKRCK